MEMIIWGIIYPIYSEQDNQNTLYIITRLVTCNCEHYENSWSSARIFVIPI